MLNGNMPRFRSGETCMQSGRFVFDGYEDGTWSPKPGVEEMNVQLNIGDEFPDIGSAEKPCWWMPAEATSSSERAMELEATCLDNRTVM